MFSTQVRYRFLFRIGLLITICGSLIRPNLLPVAFASQSQPASDTSITATSELSPEAEACQRAATTEWWGASFSSSFSASASDSEYSASTQVSSNVQLTFGVREETENEITWSVIQSSGQGTIRDSERLVLSGSWWSTEGNGPATSVGELRLDPVSCTYDLEVIVVIAATTRSSDDEPNVNNTHEIASVIIANRPIVADISSNQITIAANSTAATPIVSPRIEGAGPIPASSDAVQEADRDSFVSDGNGAATIRGINSERGNETIGAANVSWGVSRMGITDVQFKQQQVPNKSWVDVPQEGTVDGNFVRVIAGLENPTHTVIPGPVRFIDAETNQILPNGEIAQSLQPGQSAEVVYLWDTQGWTWDDNGTAHPDRRIRIEFGPANEIYNRNEQPIVVRAKPAILVHGLNSNASTWDKYPAYLQAANRTWKGYAISTMRTGNDVYPQQQSNTLLANASELAQFIEQKRSIEQAWHVDIVAHSMGGLISRQYIHTNMQTAPSVDSRPLVAHLAMLGTPNQGSLCAYGLLAINLKFNIPNVNAPAELTPAILESFNNGVTNQRNVKFSVIAGNPYPFPCSPLPLPFAPESDLVVTVKSAHHIYNDIGLTSKHHLAMTADKGIFDLWVMRHLAIGRNGEQSPNINNPMSASPMTSQAEAQPDAIQFSSFDKRDIPAGAKIDLPLAVPATAAFGVMLVTAPDVSATLISPTGATIDTINAGTDRARQMFRVLRADSPMAGNWTLRLENLSQQPTSATLGVMVGGASLSAEARVGQADQQKNVPITIRLTRNGAAVAGARVTALLHIPGATQATIDLRDDGVHGDGIANDGIYGASVAATANGSYAALIQAESGGEQRTTAVTFTSGTQQSAQKYRISLPIVQR